MSEKSQNRLKIVIFGHKYMHKNKQILRMQHPLGAKENSLSSMKYNVEAVEDEMAVLGPQGGNRNLIMEIARSWFCPVFAGC